MNDTTRYGCETLGLAEATEIGGGLPGTGCPACDGYPLPFPPSPYPFPWPTDIQTVQ